MRLRVKVFKNQHQCINKIIIILFYNIRVHDGVFLKDFFDLPIKILDSLFINCLNNYFIFVIKVGEFI